MIPSFKSLTAFLVIFCLNMNLVGESDPHKFIDSQSQEMVSIIINNQKLFAEDPELFKDKIVWNDLGQETKIKDNIVSLKGFGGETFKLKLIKNEDNINFKFEEDKLICLFPFKKST